MKKVAIIGGGLSGLSAAVKLLDNGFAVDIFETTKSLGGRAKSFYYPKWDRSLDNGQHLLMGCYDYSLDVIKKINAQENFYFQDQLSVNYVANKQESKLEAKSKLYPFNLLKAILNYDYMSFAEKLILLKFIIKIRFQNPDKFKNVSIKEWLYNNSQNDNIIKGFWHLLAISALNGELDSIPASLFLRILKQMFHRNNLSTTLIIPEKPLSEAFIDPAEKYILDNGGNIFKSTRIVGIDFEDEDKHIIKTSKQNSFEYDYIISAIQPFALSKLIKKDCNLKLNEFEYSSIISVHILLKDNPFDKKIYGLIDSEVHWLFNHDSMISLVISSADKLVSKNNDELVRICIAELEKNFDTFNKELVVDYKIVKEKKATIYPNFRVEEIREKTYLDINNFYICGDWTKTMLPATIEGAVKSGYLAAEKIINKN